MNSLGFATPVFPTTTSALSGAVHVTCFPRGPELECDLQPHSMHFVGFGGVLKVWFFSDDPFLCKSPLGCFIESASNFKTCKSIGNFSLMVVNTPSTTETNSGFSRPVASHCLIQRHQQKPGLFPFTLGKQEHEHGAEFELLQEHIITRSTWLWFWNSLKLKADPLTPTLDAKPQDQGRASSPSANSSDWKNKVVHVF